MTRARAALLALLLAAAAYPLFALQTPPGFYEGFCPPVDYHFLKPPAIVSGNKAPASGHAEIKQTTVKPSGQTVVSPGFAATNDDNPQLQLSFIPNAFQLPAGGAPEVIDIKPVADFPPAPGVAIVTNVYLVTSSTPMTMTSNLRLLYSTVLPAPSAIYIHPQSGGDWQVLNSSASTVTGCSDITAQTTTLGYVMAGYPSGSTSRNGSPRLGGGQALPIAVALAILIVVLAGIPLAVLQRRAAKPAADESPPASPRQRRRNRRRT